MAATGFNANPNLVPRGELLEMIGRIHDSVAVIRGDIREIKQEDLPAIKGEVAEIRTDLEPRLRIVENFRERVHAAFYVVPPIAAGLVVHFLT